MGFFPKQLKMMVVYSCCLLASFGCVVGIMWVAIHFDGFHFLCTHDVTLAPNVDLVLCCGPLPSIIGCPYNHST